MGHFDSCMYGESEFMSLIKKIALGLIAISMSVGCFSVDTKTVDQLVNTWISLEKQRVSLVNSWEVKREMLNQQITLLEKEQESLRHIVAKSEGLSDEVELELERSRLIELFKPPPVDLNPDMQMSFAL